MSRRPRSATSPDAGVGFAPLPKAAATAKNYPAWQKSFASWVSSAQRLELWRHAALQLTSKPGESERDFRIRVQNAQREARDAAVESVRQKFAAKRARAGREAAQGGAGRHARAAAGHEPEACRPRSRLARPSSARSSDARRSAPAPSAGRRPRPADSAAARRKCEDVQLAQQNVEAIQTGARGPRRADRRRDEGDRRALRRGRGNVEKVAVAPKRGQVDVQFVTLGWKAK